MANTQHTDTQNARIQGLLARFLELRSKDPTSAPRIGHLDEDTLNAFTEGNLNQREALPVVNHLSDCSFCRHKTAELVRLDLEFADMDAPAQVGETAEPVSVSSVLSSVLSRIFGTSEAAVFAHEERKEEAEPEQDKEEGKPVE